MLRLKHLSSRIGLRSVVALAGAGLVALLMAQVLPELVANIERVQTLRGLDLSGPIQSTGEMAWDAGWRSLCRPVEDSSSSVPRSFSDRSVPFVALAGIDQGDYVTTLALLRQLEEEGETDQVPNAHAYLAALQMDWVGAARAYQPQPMARHERWWGTVFYLAAQELTFEGRAKEAGTFYRQADAAYGVQGPYLGLGLAECLVGAGRSLEAWDAYRRALVVLSADEALAYLLRFSELRLEGLQAWRERDPGNEQVARWLAFYEEEGQAGSGSSESELLDGEPAPQVSLKLDLADGWSLLGFDYRAEDIETGPFMVVDFYLQERQGERVQYRRVRRTVLNQAPNGAFAWDAVPDGMRPVGWHGLVYSPDLTALYREEILPGEAWLCLDAGLVGTSFGLQSLTVPLPEQSAVYVQGGQAFLFGVGSLSLGRTWFGVPDPYNYSYVGGGRMPDETEVMAGAWQPPEGTDGVAVWLLSHGMSKGCFRDTYLFTIPEF